MVHKLKTWIWLRSVCQPPSQILSKMEVMLPLPGALQGWPHALGKLSNDNH